MFKRIDIQKFGLFEGFKWSKELNDNQLNKVNIIYGRNYSGKTTLSRIFGSIGKGELPEKYQNGVFTITDESGNTVTNSKLKSNYKVRVYNTDFVKDNLSWLHDDKNGEIKPFTLLGEGNITAQSRIDEIVLALGSTDNKKGLYFDKEQKNKEVVTAKQKEKKKSEEIIDSLTHQANKVIKVDKYFVKQGDNYNVNSIKAEIEAIEKAPENYILDTESQEKHKKIIDEVEKPAIKEISVAKVQLSQSIVDTEELIKKRITVTNTIKELLEDSLLQSWVEKGLEHHKNKRTTCAFCNSDILPERWQQLDEHFSKESEELKKLIKDKVAVIGNAKTSIVNYLQNQDIKKEHFYTAFHPKFESLIKEWDKVVIEYCNIADLLVEKLNERYTDIFKPKEFSDTQKSVLETSSLISAEIVRILESLKVLSIENNGKTETLSDDKDNSRKLLRYSAIQSFLDVFSYETQKKELETSSNSLKSIETDLGLIVKTIEELEKEKKQKELELNDEGEAAKKVNNHLNNFFGHDGLTLKPEVIEGTEPRTRFVIMRGSEKAHNLSEGECSLISFCYFIAKMEDELNGTDNEKLVIYIDDPISSLDNNHIFFMFSLIETVIAKEKKYGQLLISTHNHDFLKYIKRLTIPKNEKNEELVSHYIIEKNKKDGYAKSIIKEMPSHLKDYVTEYNFLFKEIYDIAKPFTKGDRVKYFENQYTQLYNLPNNMRKFLECYLFYRFPNTENPLNNLSLLFDNHIPALVNRVVNEYSHLSWGQRGTIVMDVVEAESVAMEILKAIYKKDSLHYNALCESIKVENEIDFT